MKSNKTFLENGITTDEKLQPRSSVASSLQTLANITPVHSRRFVCKVDEYKRTFMQLEMIMDSEENVSSAESTEAMDTLPQLSRKQEMERLVKVQKQHRDCGRMHAAFIKVLPSSSMTAPSLLAIATAVAPESRANADSRSFHTPMMWFAPVTIVEAFHLHLLFTKSLCSFMVKQFMTICGKDRPLY